MSCSTKPTLEANPVSLSSLTCPRHRHLISGTFNSNLLHILSFDTLTRSLSLLSSLPAYGPHSFLTAGKTSLSTNRLADTVYATTWAEKPELCAFKLNWQDAELKGLEWLGNVPITATSSYVHVQPPPFDILTSPSYGVEAGPSRYLYSAGGPTGEVHSINPETGALEGKTQELIFLREGEKALAKADKTRVALRYGAHNVDIGKNRLAFIADVGRNSILTYKQDQEDGSLTMLGETFMPEEGDGPRHVVPSPCGRFAYSVTEHTSYVDVYRIEKDGSVLQHLQRVSILPSSATSSMESIHQYRGDTVRLSPDGKFLFATTRGKESKTRGFVKVWQIEDDVLQEKFVYQTRNSGGKANAIEFAPRYAMKSQEGSTLDYAVLTDDQEGFITILEWDGTDLRDVTSIQLPALENGQAQGASQAIWVA